METKVITTDRCIRICGERAVLEGNIALPYDETELAAVLEICGCAEILSAASEAERVLVSGKARYTVLYVNRSGVTDSFDSECSFEHAFAAEGAVPDMQVCANACVTGTAWRISGNGIEVRSEISLSLVATAGEEHEILLRQNDGDLQYDTVTGEVIACSQKSIKAYVNHDLRIPQNLPEAKKILSVKAQAELKNIRKETDRIITEGELHFCILYESADKNAPLQVLHETASFGEILRDGACIEDSVIFADVSVDKVSAELTAGDTMALSGILSVCTLCVNRRPQEFVRDVYSLTEETELRKDSIGAGYPVLLDALRKTLRMETTIPESAPEASRILYAAARPEVMGIVNGEKLTVDGLMHISLIYTTAESGIKSAQMKEPFELEMGNVGDVSEVRAFCPKVTAQGSGRDIVLKAGIQLCLCGQEDESVSAVTAAEIIGPRQEVLSGVAVHFADEGETVWEICRKWGVQKDCAMPLDSAEPLHRGDRVMVMG